MESQDGVHLRRLLSGKRRKKTLNMQHVFVQLCCCWSQMRCFPRTLAESTESSLSSDSYEYYHTEIYEQLPSVLASRSGHDSQGTWERQNIGAGSGDSVSHGSLHRPQKDKESTQPIRHLTTCIQAKRDARWVVIKLLSFLVASRLNMSELWSWPLCSGVCPIWRKYIYISLFV